MKKSLLALVMTVFTVGMMKAQCVYTCTNYAVSAITFTTFPQGNTNITPTFTNPYFSGPATDDGSIWAPIGFNFDYYCNTYTGVYITSNGFIQLDYTPLVWNGAVVHPTQNFPSGTAPNGMVAFNMTDLYPGLGGSVNYTTVGTAPYRMFIVTYSNVPCYTSPNDPNTGQIVLFETTNLIEIHTTKARPDPNQGTLGGTQGIENTLGSMGVCPPGRNANNTWGNSNNDNTAYRFGPYTPVAPTSVTGNTLVCQGDTNIYVSATNSAALGYVWNVPAGWTGGTSTVATASIAAGSTVGTVSVSAMYTCGTSSAAVITVSVIPAPFIGITSVTPSILCSGNTVTLNLSGGASYTVQPNGASGQSPLMDVPMTSTTYTVKGANADGCKSTNSPTISVLVLETPTVTVNSGSVCLGQSFVMTPGGANTYSYSNGFSTANPTVVGISSYTVVGTATNGCKGEAVSNVTVNPLPTTTLTVDRTTICNKESITLTASGASTYSWTHTTSTTAILSATPVGNTAYSVVGTSSAGCVKSASVVVTVKACTGLDEQTMRVVRLFPNPSMGVVTIELEANDQVFIYDMLGALVYKKQVNAGSSTLDLRNLAEGRYIIRTESSGAYGSVVLIRE